MLDHILHIDQTLFLFLNGLHCTFLDPIMVFITGNFSWIPLYVAIFFFLFWKRDWRWGLLAFVTIIITFAITDQLAVHLFKNTVQRLRPCHEPALEGMVRLLEGCGGRFGFVSNHAANTFGLATVTALIFHKKWYTWSIFGWAAIVSYSRIYVGKHYPLDLIVGALFGMLVGWCVWKTLQFLQRKQIMYSLYFWPVIIIMETFMFFTGVIILIFTFPFDPMRRVVDWHSTIWAKMHYWMNPGWKVDYSGGEHVKQDRPYVIVCNHQSMLDIVLMYYVPRVFKWVSKREAIWVPFAGPALLMHRDILIKRGSSGALKYMVNRAQYFFKHNVCVSVFPEGTRTKDGKIQRFKDGAFIMAKETGTAILPVVMNGNFDLMPKKGYSIKRKHNFQIKVLPEIPVEEVEKLSVKELSEKLHSMMLAEHQQMAPEKYALKN